jgi:hypothetical protein
MSVSVKEGDALLARRSQATESERVLTVIAIVPRRLLIFSEIAGSPVSPGVRKSSVTLNASNRPLPIRRVAFGGRIPKRVLSGHSTPQD